MRIFRGRSGIRQQNVLGAESSESPGEFTWDRRALRLHITWQANDSENAERIIPALWPGYARLELHAQHHPEAIANPVMTLTREEIESLGLATSVREDQSGDGMLIHARIAIFYPRDCWGGMRLHFTGTDGEILHRSNALFQFPYRHQRRSWSSPGEETTYRTLKFKLPDQKDPTETSTPVARNREIVAWSIDCNPTLFPKQYPDIGRWRTTWAENLDFRPSGGKMSNSVIVRLIVKSRDPLQPDKPHRREQDLLTLWPEYRKFELQCRTESDDQFETVLSRTRDQVRAAENLRSSKRISPYAHRDELLDSQFKLDLYLVDRLEKGTGRRHYRIRFLGENDRILVESGTVSALPIEVPRIRSTLTPERKLSFTIPALKPIPDILKTRAYWIAGQSPEDYTKFPLLTELFRAPVGQSAKATIPYLPPPVAQGLYSAGICCMMPMEKWSSRDGKTTSLKKYYLLQPMEISRQPGTQLQNNTDSPIICLYPWNTPFKTPDPTSRYTPLTHTGFGGFFSPPLEDWDFDKIIKEGVPEQISFLGRSSRVTPLTLFPGSLERINYRITFQKENEQISLRATTVRTPVITGFRTVSGDRSVTIFWDPLSPEDKNWVSPPKMAIWRAEVEEEHSLEANTPLMNSFKIIDFADPAAGMCIDNNLENGKIYCYSMNFRGVYRGIGSDTENGEYPVNLQITAGVCPDRHRRFSFSQPGPLRPVTVIIRPSRGRDRNRALRQRLMDAFSRTPWTRVLEHEITDRLHDEQKLQWFGEESDPKQNRSQTRSALADYLISYRVRRSHGETWFDVWLLDYRSEFRIRLATGKNPEFRDPDSLADEAVSQLAALIPDHDKRTPRPPPAEKPQSTSIAVFPFRPLNVAAETLLPPMPLLDLLINAIGQTHLKVVDRGIMAKIVDELASPFSQTRVLGKLANADVIIRGEYSITGDNVTIIARGIEVASCLHTALIEETGSISKLGLLAQQVAERLGRTPSFSTSDEQGSSRFLHWLEKRYITPSSQSDTPAEDPDRTGQLWEASDDHYQTIHQNHPRNTEPGDDSSWRRDRAYRTAVIELGDILELIGTCQKRIPLWQNALKTSERIIQIYSGQAYADRDTARDIEEWTEFQKKCAAELAIALCENNQIDEARKLLEDTDRQNPTLDTARALSTAGLDLEAARCYSKMDWHSMDSSGISEKSIKRDVYREAVELLESTDSKPARVILLNKIVQELPPQNLPQARKALQLLDYTDETGRTPLPGSLWVSATCGDPDQVKDLLELTVNSDATESQKMSAMGLALDSALEEYRIDSAKVILDFAASQTPKEHTPRYLHSEMLEKQRRLEELQQLPPAPSPDEDPIIEKAITENMGHALENRILIQTDRWQALCIDETTGEILWTRQIRPWQKHPEEKTIERKYEEKSRELLKRYRENEKTAPPAHVRRRSEKRRREYTDERIERYRKRITARASRAICLYAGKAFIADRERGILYALDMKTGSMLWSFTAWGEISQPLVDRRRKLVCVADSLGRVNLIDASDGKLRKCTANPHLDAFGTPSITWVWTETPQSKKPIRKQAESGGYSWVLPPKWRFPESREVIQVQFGETDVFLPNIDTCRGRISADICPGKILDACSFDLRTDTLKMPLRERLLHEVATGKSNLLDQLREMDRSDRSSLLRSYSELYGMKSLRKQLEQTILDPAEDTEFRIFCLETYAENAGVIALPTIMELWDSPNLPEDIDQRISTAIAYSLNNENCPDPDLLEKILGKSLSKIQLVQALDKNSLERLDLIRNARASAASVLNFLGISAKPLLGSLLEQLEKPEFYGLAYKLATMGDSEMIPMIKKKYPRLLEPQASVRKKHEKLRLLAFLGCPEAEKALLDECRKYPTLHRDTEYGSFYAEVVEEWPRRKNVISLFRKVITIMPREHQERIIARLVDFAGEEALQDAIRWLKPTTSMNKTSYGTCRWNLRGMIQDRISTRTLLLPRSLANLTGRDFGNFREAWDAWYGNQKR